MIESKPNNLRKTAALILLGCYWLALATSTHIPHPPQVVIANGWDKVFHASAYGGLAFLLSLNVALRTQFGRRQQLLIVLGLAVFAALDEITQIPVGRTCDIFDWMADMVGTVAGIALFRAATAVVFGNQAAARNQ